MPSWTNMQEKRASRYETRNMATNHLRLPINSNNVTVLYIFQMVYKPLYKFFMVSVRQWHILNSNFRPFVTKNCCILIFVGSMIFLFTPWTQRSSSQFGENSSTFFVRIILPVFQRNFIYYHFLSTIVGVLFQQPQSVSIPTTFCNALYLRAIWWRRSSKICVCHQLNAFTSFWIRKITSPSDSLEEIIVGSGTRSNSLYSWSPFLDIFSRHASRFLLENEAGPDLHKAATLSHPDSSPYSLIPLQSTRMSFQLRYHRWKNTCRSEIKGISFVFHRFSSMCDVLFDRHYGSKQ